MRSVVNAVAAGAMIVALSRAQAGDLALILTPEQARDAGITTQVLVQNGTENGSRLTLTGRVETAEHGPDPVLSPAAGRVVAVYAHPGEAVKKGAAILALAGPEIANLQRAYQDAVTMARAAAQHAQRERQLFEAGIIFKARDEQAQTSAAVADGQLKSQRQVLGSGEFGQSGRLVVRAPRAGFVSGPSFGTGDALTTGDVIAFVGAPLAPLVSLDAPVVVARSLRVGDTVTVRSRGCEGRATLHAVGRTVESSSQTVPLHAEVTLPTCLLPGEVVTASVTPQSAEVGGYAVPPTAFVRRGNATYLFARAPQGFVPITVDSDAARSGFARSSVLTPGSEVVIQGAALLKSEWQKRGST